MLKIRLEQTKVVIKGTGVGVLEDGPFLFDRFLEDSEKVDVIEKSRIVLKNGVRQACHEPSRTA